MPLTAAEKMKRYRAKLKLNPEKLEKIRLKNLERLKQKFKYIKISELTEEEKQRKRKQWREHKKKRKAKTQSSEQDSHSSNAESVDVNEDEPTGNYQVNIVLEDEPEIKIDPGSLELLEHIKFSPTINGAPESNLHYNQQYEDEFDTFGRNVAQQLRTLPLSVALETQEMLLSVLRKQRIKVLNQSFGNDPLSKIL